MGSTVELTPDMVLHRDTTDYRGPLVIENGRLSRVLFAGGYAGIRESDRVPVYHYYTLDHVGNVRAVTREDGAVVQQTDYYPFGGVIADRGFGRAVQPRKTAGKELDMMHGLGWADFGARRYDPVIPQWTQPDPMAGKYPWISPYAYCAIDPVNIVDPTGEIIETPWDLLNITYDVTAAVYHHITGDHDAAKDNWMDAALDTGAALIPGVPAGGSKAYRLMKGLDRANDARKGLRNTDAIAEGRHFEAQQFQNAVDRGENVSRHVRVVPDNGKGNVKGNRSTVDQLIKNDDGTYTIVEVKLRDTTPLSKGQRSVMEHIENGNGKFIMRSNKFGLQPDSDIDVTKHIRINKYGESPVITRPPFKKIKKDYK